MKYRKKPIVIEADQFCITDDNHPMPEGVFFSSCHEHLEEDKECENCRLKTENGYFIKTLEGLMCVQDGDYVITGIQGEKYPCKPSIFEATYDRVEEA